MRRWNKFPLELYFYQCQGQDLTGHNTNLSMMLYKSVKFDLSPTHILEMLWLGHNHRGTNIMDRCKDSALTILQGV